MAAQDAPSHRKPVHGAFKIKRRSAVMEMQRRHHGLREAQIIELKGWEDTTARLFADAEAIAEAIIRVEYSHKWAELLQRRDAPSFAAETAALKSAQAAAIDAQRHRARALIRAQRHYSRALLLDKHRRERRQLARQRIALLAEVNPAKALQQHVADHIHRRRAVQWFQFHTAGRFITNRDLAALARPQPRRRPSPPKTPKT